MIPEGDSVAPKTLHAKTKPSQIARTSASIQAILAAGLFWCNWRGNEFVIKDEELRRRLRAIVHAVPQWHLPQKEINHEVFEESGNCQLRRAGSISCGRADLIFLTTTTGVIALFPFVLGVQLGPMMMRPLVGAMSPELGLKFAIASALMSNFIVYATIFYLWFTLRNKVSINKQRSVLA